MRCLSMPIVALLTTTSLAQWLPSCNWNDCMVGWQTDCASASGWDCLCGNATALAQINTCVATSCTNNTDQEAIYGAIAQLCANNDITVTNTQEATFSATSGGSLWPTITGAPNQGPGWGPNGRWNSDTWSSWISACSSAIGSAPSGWNGGPWGGWHGGNPGAWSSGYWGGPWGTKASGVDCEHWTTWTAGWGPFSSWTGLWSGCSTTTATPKPATVTTTVTTDGATSVITGTTFGVQAVIKAETGSDNAAAPTGNAALSVFGGAAAAVFGLMVAL